MILNTKTGWIEEISQIFSPNFNARPNGILIDLLVIHCISLPEGEYKNNYIIDLFQNKLDIKADSSFKSLENLKVSAHFLIRRSGEIVQFVSIYDRAWHAGESSFLGKTNCNDYAIGIELEGTDKTPFELIQYEKLIQLTNILIDKTAINKNRIVSHSMIAPKRKTDPGQYFDWDYYLKNL